MYKKMQCRVCDSQNLEQVIDLGNQPWCNNFLSESQIGKEDSYQIILQKLLRMLTYFSQINPIKSQYWILAQMMERN